MSNSRESASGRLVVPAGDFGLTATLGLSLLFVLIRNNNREIRQFASTVYGYCRAIIHSLLIVDDEDDDNNGNGWKRKGKKNHAREMKEDRRITRHKGACHCTAVAFYVRRSQHAYMECLWFIMSSFLSSLFVLSIW